MDNYKELQRDFYNRISFHIETMENHNSAFDDFIFTPLKYYEKEDVNIIIIDSVFLKEENIDSIEDGFNKSVSEFCDQVKESFGRNSIIALYLDSRFITKSIHNYKKFNFMALNHCIQLWFVKNGFEVNNLISKCSDYICVFNANKEEYYRKVYTDYKIKIIENIIKDIENRH